MKWTLMIFENKRALEARFSYDQKGIDVVSAQRRCLFTIYRPEDTIRYEVIRSLADVHHIMRGMNYRDARFYNHIPKVEIRSLVDRYVSRSV